MVANIFLGGKKYRKYKCYYATTRIGMIILNKQIFFYVELIRKLVQEVQIMSGCFRVPKSLVKSKVLSMLRPKRMVR